MADTSAKTINFLIDSKFKNISVASAAIRAVSKELALSEIDAYYLELCVMEAINNAIQHAYASEEGHIVGLSVSYTPSEIVVKISDSGRRMTLYVPDPPDFVPENISSVPDHGLGLYIIHSVMDQITYETSGNVNTLTMQKIFYRS